VKKSIIKPSHFILVTIAINLLCFRFLDNSQTVVIVWEIVITGTLFFFWAIYRFAYNFLISNYLIWSHSIITLLFFILVLGMLKWNDELFNNAEIPSYIKRQVIKNRVINIAIIIFFLGQIAFATNIVGGFLRQRKQKRQLR
jgi:hypothetical protein